MAALATPAMAERAPTSLRRAAGATDPAALSSLLHQLLADNDRRACAEIIDSDMDESGRSPLHHACWRGALANVETLLDLGCDHGAWSTGLHSYGKTPLFYATTRCRDEVVRLLLAHGAKTRVLNNKGQSVLSLAASHLKPEVIEALVLAEREEGDELPEVWQARLQALPEAARPLVRPGGWLDFWASHPDGQAYGDLDPRFYEAADGDLIKPHVINPTSHEGRRLHRHLPGARGGARSQSWWPQGQGASPGGRASTEAEVAAAAAAAAPPRYATPEEAAAARALPEAEVEAAAAPMMALLTQYTTEAVVEAEAKAGTAEVAAGSEVAADAARSWAYLVAAAADDLVARLSEHKGAWLQAAARSIARAAGGGEAVATLLQQAAALGGGDAGGGGGDGDGDGDGDGGGGSAVRRALSDAPAAVKMRRRLLLAAAQAPSAAAEAVAVAVAQEAATQKAARKAARKAALAAAERRRVVRLDALGAGRAPPRAAPPPAVVRWVDDCASLEAMAAAMAAADVVGVDTEWMDGPTGRRGASDAVLATVQLGVRTAGGGPEAEVAWVCDAVRGGGEGTTGESAFPVFTARGVAIDGSAAAAGGVGAAQQQYHEALAALLRLSMAKVSPLGGARARPLCLEGMPLCKGRGPLGALSLLLWLLELAAFKVAHSTAFDHVGGASSLSIAGRCPSASRSQRTPLRLLAGYSRWRLRQPTVAVAVAVAVA
eukprot:scaffold100290_cov70-Phaeocystis_antarctica.AAC.1